MTRMNNNEVLDFINKVISSEVKLNIAIEDENNQNVGFLKPITKIDVDNVSLLQNLTKWRSDNMEMFITNFAATPERTSKYLDKITATGSRQTLFVIEEKGKTVGQVGWKDLTENDAIMDNGMKGERTINPKLMIYAHKSLAKWLFLNTNIKFMYGWLFADNIPGIMMNKQIGWSKWIRHPMMKLITGDEWVWDIGSEGKVSPDNKYCFKLIMTQGDILGGS
jgi:hypothetical protein